MVQKHWTSPDLDQFPADNRLYEIIAGELFISDPHNFFHQELIGRLYIALSDWSRQTKLGYPNHAPGLILAPDDDVAPDIVWLSNERLRTSLHSDGWLYEPPELIAEVLLYDGEDDRRDRIAKLDLYSRYDVLEYWIVDWRARTVEVYRRQPDSDRLERAPTVTDQLTTPLLPGFSLSLTELFARFDKLYQTT